MTGLVVVGAGRKVNGGFGNTDRARVQLLRQHDSLRIHGDFSKAFRGFRRAALLGAASEIFGQKFFRRHEHGEIVYRAGKAVALVGREQVFDGKPRSRSAMTICSASRRFTRGSLAP